MYAEHLKYSIRSSFYTLSGSNFVMDEANENWWSFCAREGEADACYQLYRI